MRSLKTGSGKAVTPRRAPQVTYTYTGAKNTNKPIKPKNPFNHSKKTNGLPVTVSENIVGNII